MGKKIPGLKSGEYLVVRAPNGRFTKFKSDRKLIFEVRAKTKSKKAKSKTRHVRYLNKLDRKTKEPLPMKLSSFQLKFLTAKRTRQLKAVTLNQVTVELNSRFMIIEQLIDMGKGKPIVRMVRNALRRRDQVAIYGDLATDTGESFRSPMVIVGKYWTDDEILKAVAMEIVVNPVRDNALRMSPKKYARGPKERNRRQIKKAWLTVYVAKF